MSEFGVADAKLIAKRLEEEIKDSSDNTQEKEDLVGLINILINMPNLLNEKKKLDDAISKNRGILKGLEETVDSKEKEAGDRIAELNKQVLASETNLSNVVRDNNAKIQENTIDTDGEVSAYKEKGEGKKRAINREVQEAEEMRDKIITKTAAAESRLKLFQENVAKMNVADM